MSRTLVAAVAGLAAAAVLSGCTPAGRPATSEAPTAPGRGTTPSLGSGTADSPLCRDFLDLGGRAGNLRPHDRYTVALWRKLAQEAPAQIKPDAAAVARFLARRSGAGGNAPGVTASLRRVTDWVTRNCI